jgi:[ribosomal protein S5]-alanine N-acetyltransferase
MPVVETERLVIRQLSPGDAAFILELLNDPSFLRSIGDRGVRDLAGARQYVLDGAVASHVKHGYGLDLVTLKSTGEPAGICGLVRRDYLDHPDIGFAFLPRLGGQGHAFEAASVVLARAFGSLGMHRVLAIVSPDNARSIRLLDKLGFRYEGMITPTGEDRAVRLLSASA